VNPDVLIHIGHGGTGTSFLQRTFANTQFKCLVYNDHSGAVEKSQTIGVPTGNVRKSDDLYEFVKKTTTDKKPILFSSEILFGRFGSDTNDLWRLISDGHKVKILLFTRDPLDHVITSYGQFVKRGIFLGSIETFMETYNSPQKVALRIKQLERLGCEVNLVNYSRHELDLKSLTEDWLGERLANITNTVVNRSLTSSEIEFILKAGKHLGSEVRRIGNSLCLGVPEVKKDKLKIERHVCEKFAERMNIMISSINPSLLVSERYEVPDNLEKYIRGAGQPDITLSSKQLSVALNATLFLRNNKLII
jgi:hypothetical protein